MPGTLSKLLEDLPVLNSLNPLVEIAAARLERWSPKDTGIVLAAAAAGGIALGYYYYSHLDPSLKQILTGKVDRGNVARQIQEKGPISQIYGISGHGYMVWGEESGKWLLQKEKLNLYSGKEGRSYFFRLLFKGSILDKDNEEHTRTRRLLSSAFKSDSLRAYLPRMTSEIRSEFDLWVKMSQESGFVDLELELKQLALRFAFTLLVGADFTKDHSISTELVEKYEALLRGFIPWPIGKWDARKKSMEARQALVDDVTEIIRKRRKLLLEGVKPEFSDPLWLLMTTKDENGHSYTDEELADECVVLVIAGHETTARTLAAWTVELLRHPSLITALRKEQEDLVKSYPCDADNNYTNEHIKHMPLLDATFREIERMYGPAGEISRVTRNDITFVPADGGKPTVIKKGNRIAWSVTATNRDPAVYPEPNAFNPCRWLNSSLTSSPTLSKDQDSDLGAVKVSSFRLGTFGAGHRVCLGMQFARMEMLLIGGLMIKDYDFEDVDPECDLVEVGRPKFGYKDGIRVRFKRRA